MRRSAPRVNRVVESKCMAEISAEAVARTKLLWSEKTIDARLAALYFTDATLVRRAYAIQTKLYESELACYHRGMCSRGPGHYRDAAGKPVVVNGLKYFQFEWPQGKAVEPASLDTTTPIALYVTRELVEDSDFFGYMERQLAGARSLFSVSPALLRHRSLETMFDPLTNSWMEFERQLIQLMEVVLVKLETRTSSGSHAEVFRKSAKADSTATSLSEEQLAEQDRVASAAGFAILDLEEQDRLASQAAKLRNTAKKAKKKARLAEARLAEVLEPDEVEEAEAGQPDQELDASSKQFDDADSVASMGQSTSCTADLSTECGGSTSYQHSRTSSIMTEATSRDMPQASVVLFTPPYAPNRLVRVARGAAAAEDPSRQPGLAPIPSQQQAPSSREAEQRLQQQQQQIRRGRRAASMEPPASTFSPSSHHQRQQRQRSPLTSRRQPATQVRARSRCRSADPQVQRQPQGLQHPPGPQQGPPPLAGPPQAAAKGPPPPPPARPRIGPVVARPDVIVPIVPRAAPPPQVPKGPTVQPRRDVIVPTVPPRAAPPPQVPEGPTVQPRRPVWVSNGHTGDASQWCLVHPNNQLSPFAQAAGRAELRVRVRRTFVDVPPSLEAQPELSRRRRSQSCCIRR